MIAQFFQRLFGLPLWRYRVCGHEVIYKNENNTVFSVLREIESQTVQLFKANSISQAEYQSRKNEIEKAKESFLLFRYGGKQHFPG